MFGKMKRNERTPNDNAGTPVFHCSFCNKSQRDVRRLIAGPNVYICDECVDICLDILAEERKDRREASASKEAEGQRSWARSNASFCALCRLPVTVAEAIVVEGRGLICKGCRGEIEAAIAREKAER